MSLKQNPIATTFSRFNNKFKLSPPQSEIKKKIIEVIHFPAEQTKILRTQFLARASSESKLNNIMNIIKLDRQITYKQETQIEFFFKKKLGVRQIRDWMYLSRNGWKVKSLRRLQKKKRGVEGKQLQLRLTKARTESSHFDNFYSRRILSKATTTPTCRGCLYDLRFLASLAPVAPPFPCLSWTRGCFFFWVKPSLRKETKKGINYIKNIMCANNNK